MAWTNPKTWFSGAITASEFNAQIRDNLAWLKAALATHGITSDTTRGPVLSARYGASALTTGASVSSDADVGIQFAVSDEEWKDAAGMHNDVNPRSFYPQGDFTYHVLVWASFAANSNGSRAVWIERSDGTQYNLVRVPATGSATNVSTGAYVEMAAGQSLALFVRQSSGSTLAVSARFQMVRVGA